MMGFNMRVWLEIVISFRLGLNVRVYFGERGGLNVSSEVKTVKC